MLSVCPVRPTVCESYANISETKRDGAMVTIKHESSLEVPDSESAIKFVTRSRLPYISAFHAASQRSYASSRMILS